MNEISEFLEELYIASTRMDNKELTGQTLTREQYIRIHALGLPPQRSKVTIYRAIKYLENFPLGYLQENQDGSDNDFSTTGSD